MLRSRTGFAAAALVLLAILFVSVNIIAGRTLGPTRIDLTQQRIYTLSDPTRDLLRRIREPVTLTLYYSTRLGQEVPAYGVYAQRVRETLQEYAARSGGKVRLAEADPAPFSDTEDRAVAAGLQGVPVEQGGDQVYFGLVGTDSTDDQQVIPFFQPERERFLEYDLTRMVETLAFPRRKVIGLVSALPMEGDYMAAMQGQPLQAYAVLDQLRQVFDVHSLGTDIDQIPADVDELMLVHPAGLSDKTQYAIDQFALRGGRILAFVDPNAENAAAHRNPMAPAGTPPASDLPRLFKAWGLEMVKDKVVGDANAARRVGLPGGRNQVAEYLPWLALRGANFDGGDPVTQDLAQINVATAGILKPLPGAKTTFTPLFRSSSNSEMIDVKDTKGSPDVIALLRGFKATGDRYTIAARVTGPIDTAFPDGPPRDAAKPDRIEAIVVADTDLLEDRLWAQTQDFLGQRVVTPTASNGDFVLNAAESLSGGTSLMSLRSRGTLNHPFQVVEDLQRDAEQRYRSQEKDLEDSLKTTQAKLASLRQGAAVTAEQQKEIDDFQTRLLDTRRQLRKVQSALRATIDQLRDRLIFVDAALVPILVALVAIGLGLWRLARRRRTTAA
jgi:ABC-type uncharacterized transport system involved in gliding motility auxiliary subunit